jgi:hypothetical protein
MKFDIIQLRETEARKKDNLEPAFHAEPLGFSLFSGSQP